MLDKLHKLREWVKDGRGNTDEVTKGELDHFHDAILIESRYKELSETTAGKNLIAHARSYLLSADQYLGGKDSVESKMRVLDERKAWITIIQVLSGAKSRLEVLEGQIDYELNN